MLAVPYCIGLFPSFSLGSTLRHIYGTYIAVMMMSWCDDDHFFENFEIFKNESTETGNDRNVGGASLYRLIASVVAAIHSLARADQKCVADMMT